MTFPRDKIQPEHTYKNDSGTMFYVHDITGKMVNYCKLGSVDRNKVLIGRFASMIVSEVPNQ
jgi:hypothetical protein